MRLINQALMAQYMQRSDITGAQLARKVGRELNRNVSRQFINSLINHPTKRSATREVAEAIEVALDLLPGTLFISEDAAEELTSPPSRRSTQSSRVSA